MLEVFDSVVLSKIFSYLSLYDRIKISVLNTKLHSKIVNTKSLLIHNLTVDNDIFKINKYFCKYEQLANGITEMHVTDNSNIDLSMFPKVRKLYLKYGLTYCNIKNKNSIINFFIFVNCYD